MNLNARVLISFGFGALLAFAGLMMRLNSVSLAIILNSHLTQPLGGFARPLAETANVFLLAGFLVEGLALHGWITMPGRSDHRRDV